VLRLATRGSPLALRQTALVAEQLQARLGPIEIEPMVVTTRGDRQRDLPLDRIGGQGAFVKEVQLAVLEGRADAAVHSAKDLPSDTSAALRLACVPPREDPRDVLVGSTLDELGPGAVVATGSARRRAQLANLRPDLTFVELRGNIGTRLERARDGTVHAVVTAMAALRRLGLEEQAAQVLSPLQMLPQVGQGALALECREDDASTAEVLSSLDDPESRRRLLAERSVLATLGASCAAPVGAFAETAPDGALELEAVLASADGRILVRARRRGSDPVATGQGLARALVVEHGASAIEGVGPLEEPS
jgi:hydroxymethylbilane synthase